MKRGDGQKGKITVDGKWETENNGVKGCGDYSKLDHHDWAKCWFAIMDESRAT